MPDTAALTGTADDGFHEAVAIVLDVDASAWRLCEALGYRVMWSGAACPGALRLLGVDPAASARETLIGDPAQGRGFIRLLAFPDRPGGVMRDGAQPWDTGGIFDINVRALGGAESLHGAMTQAGFAAFAPITAFTFAGMAVKEVVERDADGLAIAVIERVSPALTGFEDVAGPASFVFNSSQIVPSLSAARDLMVGVLGWEPVAEVSWVHEDGRSAMGFPPDIARTRRINVGIYQAAGRNVGSLEFIEYEGESLDFSCAAPPDRGWAALRLPVSDLAGFSEKARRGGLRVSSEIEVSMAPHGLAKAVSAVTPWGARLEAYTPI